MVRGAPSGGAAVGRPARSARGDRRLLESVRDGFSGVLVLSGDAGVSKSRFLEFAAYYAVQSAAQDLTVVRLGWRGGRARLGYGALHGLLRPYLGRLPAAGCRL